MPADRLLGTLLRSLQTYTDQQDTPRLLGTASSLLTTLNNPLNVTLLTSHLLSAPAIWAQQEGLRTCMRCMSVFHSAAQALIRHEFALHDKSADKDFERLQLERTLPKDDWIRAVINGADKHSPRWRHLLVIGGLLVGFGPVHHENITRSMHRTLEEAVTKAVNLALKETPEDDELGQQSIALVLNYCFPNLSDHERAQVDYDRLLPLVMHVVFHSLEGLRSAYFLGAINVDIQQMNTKGYHWPERSQSYQRVQEILSSHLVSSLGPLARLIGHIIDHVNEPWLVTAALDDLADFAKTLHLQWRQNKLAEIDEAVEQEALSEETLRVTTPTLWKLLRSILFASVIILRSAIGRLLGDGSFKKCEVAAGVATQALQTLRSMYFISTRSGFATFSQYKFVNLTAMDMLATDAQRAEAFLYSIKPGEPGVIPDHPLDRNLDLFFLNTAEHFAIVLSPKVAAELLVPSASPYLATRGDNHLLLIFEAAHSVMLAAFSSPQNATLTEQRLAFYVHALFAAFPNNLSAHQFRIAFRTLVQVTAPPSPLSATQPMLPAILLELVHERTGRASIQPIPSQPAVSTPDAALVSPIQLSEQAVLVLAIIDTFTQLPLDLLDEWLPLAADLVSAIDDPGMSEHCIEHFWHVLLNGGMDPERSWICHAWWSSSGGRDMVLFGRGRDQAQGSVMSGALADLDSSTSKL